MEKTIPAIKELISSCNASGDLHEAINPNHVAYNNQGNALKNLNRMDEALLSYDRAIALKPDYALAYNNRGVVLNELKRLDEAIVSYDSAITLKSDYAEAYYNRGIALNNLKRLNEALLSFDRAITLKPDYAAAYNNRGNALRDLSRLDEALLSFDRAIDLKSDYATAYNNRGNALRDLNRLDEALLNYDHAITLKPEYAAAYNNRGNLLKCLNRMEEALLSFDHAIALTPGHAEANLNKSFLKLLMGKYEEGWALYKWPNKKRESKNNYLEFSQLLWLSETPLQGKTLLLRAEHGVGYEVFFISILLDAYQQAKAVTVTVDARLLPLLQRSMPKICFLDKTSAIDASAYDVHLRIGSLGKLFRNSLKDFSNAKYPYLFADKGRAVQIRNCLLDHQQIENVSLIGISWRTNSKFSAADRSMTLEQLATQLLSANPNLCLVSLQYGDVTDEIAQLKQKTGITILQAQDVDNYNDLEGFSALIDACDLIVSIQNSTVHFAGALGKPVWVLLCHVPDWRWMLDRTDSPWYPTAKLFRQPARGDWDSVLMEIRSKITNWHREVNYE